MRYNATRVLSINMFNTVQIKILSCCSFTAIITYLYAAPEIYAHANLKYYSGVIPS